MAPKMKIKEGQEPGNARKAAPGVGEGREVDYPLAARDGTLQADNWGSPHKTHFVPWRLLHLPLAIYSALALLLIKPQAQKKLTQIYETRISSH